jgi:hypothetical protein
MQQRDENPAHVSGPADRVRRSLRPGTTIISGRCSLAAREQGTLPAYEESCPHRSARSTFMQAL